MYSFDIKGTCKIKCVSIKTYALYFFVMLKKEYKRMDIMTRKKSLTKGEILAKNIIEQYNPKSLKICKIL